MPAILLHLLPASLYALLGVHFWHTRWIAPTSAPREQIRIAPHCGGGASSDDGAAGARRVGEGPGA